MKKFTCGACGETFEKGRPEREALAEREALFPGVDPKEFALVCDDCWKKMDAFFGFTDWKS